MADWDSCTPQRARLEELGLAAQPLASIAKREEILYLYGQEDEPIVLDRHSPVLLLIQQIRDEAHRFAVTFHRKRRQMRDRTTGTWRGAGNRRDDDAKAAATFWIAARGEAGELRGTDLGGDDQAGRGDSGVLQERRIVTSELYNRHPKEIPMSKQEEANLILKLYELRREEVMRKGRDWYFSQFNPKTVEDFTAAMFGEHSGHLRMVVTYWEMAAGLVNNGAIDLKLFSECNGEHIGVFSKIEPILAEIRAAYSPRYAQNLEKLIDATPDGRKMVAAQRERMAAVRDRMAAAQAAKK